MSPKSVNIKEEGDNLVSFYIQQIKYSDIDMKCDLNLTNGKIFNVQNDIISVVKLLDTNTIGLDISILKYDNYWITALILSRQIKGYIISTHIP